MRAEFAAIGAGFDLLPETSGNASAVVVVNSAGDALEASSLTVPSESGVLATINDSSQNAGRNFFHNPRFSIQQRGAGAWTSQGYTADRWNLSVVGGDTDSVTAVALADADRAAIGDESAEYALQDVFSGSGTSGSYSVILQRVEDVRRLGNKTATVSFWAKATSGTPKIGVGYQQNFGSGGSPSALVLGNIGVTAALSATWTRYEFTAPLPSTSGKTLGTTADTSYTQVDFWLSCNDTTYNSESGNIGVQSGTVQLWGMQIEIGSSATPLEPKDPMLDLALCQRFYATGNSFAAASTQGASGYVSAWIRYPVSMRTIPTISRQDVGPSSNIDVFLGYSATSQDGAVVSYVSAAAGNADMEFNWQASADL